MAKEASKSTHQYQIGAITLNNGQILSKGFNRYSRLPRPTLRMGEGSIHAEQIALRRTGRSRPDTIIVARIVKQGFSMASPCKRCLAHIKRAGIKTIYYTDWEGNLIKKRF